MSFDTYTRIHRDFRVLSLKCLFSCKSNPFEIGLRLQPCKGLYERCSGLGILRDLMVSMLRSSSTHFSGNGTVGSFPLPVS